MVRNREQLTNEDVIRNNSETSGDFPPDFTTSSGDIVIGDLDSNDSSLDNSDQ